MTTTRRHFIKSLAAAAAFPAARALASSTPAEKLPLSAPLTHSDWMLKPGMKWGPEGVYHMLDACKACGWSRVHWRVLDGGRAVYASKLVRPAYKVDADYVWDPQTEEGKALYKKYFGNIGEEQRKKILADQQRYDYGTFDTFAEAVRYGHKIGLKIDAWVTINEDDHGWGITSDFARQHPQFVWVKRDGTKYHSQMSFAFPEVRAYKLGIIDELLTSYDLDGLFLDWIRTGDIRDNPQTDAQGIADNGYEQPNINAFKAKHGVDPHDVPNDDDRWVRLRAEPQTQFMQAVRDRVNAHHKKIPIAVMVGHPWHYRGMQDPIDGSLRGLLLDLQGWSRKHLIDAAIAAGYYRAGGNATTAFEAVKKEVGNRADVWYYAWVPNKLEDFTADFDAAVNLKAKNVLFWEADYIDDRSNAAALKQAMSARARWS